MTSTRPPNEPSAAIPAALEPSIVLSAEEAHVRAAAEEELYERVVRYISPRLYAKALRRLKSRRDAEILVNDVCSSAWESQFIQRCAGEMRRMVSYLTRAMDNHLINKNRGRDRESKGIAHYKAVFLATLKKSRTPDEDVIAHEIDRIVDGALEDLPAVFREAFNLVCRDGMTYEEAAEILQKKSNTIRVYVSKAKRHVAKALAAAGYGPASKAHAEKKEHTS
jgi:RNA polymerase sigma-70 factor (ECF subfamily)